MRDVLHDVGLTTEAADRPVLVPVDFAPRSGTALLVGSQIAGSASVPLVVLHVARAPGNEATRHHGRDIEDMAKEQLELFVSRLKKQHPDAESLRSCCTMVTTGIPARAIRDIAEWERVGVIVMARGNRTRAGRVVYGSVTDQVVRSSPCTVLIVNGGQMTGVTIGTSNALRSTAP